MYVKICANTNLEDARLAAELGASAVGFVFAPSKRQVTPQQVRAITDHLPHSLERVGVFTSQDAKEIARTVVEAGLTGVQLHAALPKGEQARLRTLVGDDVRVIPVLHWDVADDAGSAQRLAHSLGDVEQGGVVLLDAKRAGASGGLGVALNWKAACGVFAERPDLRVVLAGGLRPENVREAIQTFQPWGVDVASGVERAPGQKDAERVREFIQAASSC